MKEIVTIKGKLVIEIYESFDGSYWFITEKCYKQDSIINSKVYDDQILFGYARLSACPQFAEFGYISETELKLLGNRIWKVPRKNWGVCPEVEVKCMPNSQSVKNREGQGDNYPQPSDSYFKYMKGGEWKMEIDLRNKIAKYVSLLDEIKEWVGDDQTVLAVAILQEIGKDLRTLSSGALKPASDGRFKPSQ